VSRLDEDNTGDGGCGFIAACLLTFSLVAALFCAADGGYLDWIRL
jgi:hypothetical protein